MILTAEDAEEKKRVKAISDLRFEISNSFFSLCALCVLCGSLLLT